MTTFLPSSQCLACRHFRGPQDAPGVQGTPGIRLVCAAFPRGIPDAITYDHHDHRERFPGDRGTRWEPVTPDATFPALDPQPMPGGDDADDAADPGGETS